MNIRKQEKEISLNMSSKLEYLMKVNHTTGKELANYIGITMVNFSRIRNRLKAGKFPPTHFTIGISKYYNTNFF